MLETRQIGFADLVVLNKVDPAGSEQVAWVRTGVDTMMDRVRPVEAVQAGVPRRAAGSGSPGGSVRRR